MGYSILVVALAFALTSGEKLGDIEVITRGELGSRGLVPPDPLPNEQADVLSKVNANLVSSVEQKPEEKFIPLPALSYLPPVETPLPIESTEAPVVTTRVILPEEYLPPRGVADEIKPVVETPNTLYSAPKPAPAVDQFVTEAPVVFQAQTQRPVYPIGVAAGAQPPLPIGPPAPNDGYYLEEEVGGPEGFFSGIRDSKVTLLGGIVGAKSAVLQGLRNAKDSIASGVTDALAHKAAAFSSLKTSIGSAFSGSPADVSYDDVNEGGYGSNTNVDVGGPAGAGTVDGEFPVPPIVPLPVPPIPLPPIPVPVFVPVKPASPYPIYPPYAEPVYPQPRPVYRPKPNLLGGLRAKLEGIAEAKRNAVAGAIAQVDAIKEGFRQKIDNIFHNKRVVVRAPYYPVRPNNPQYPQSYYPNGNTNKQPSVHDVFHKQPIPYPVYQSKPVYVHDSPQYITYGNTAAITEQFEAKKAAIARAISRVVAKIKAPFHHFNYRRW